jgi:glycosyltransferase involved in cell wall biosynthesis
MITGNEGRAVGKVIGDIQSTVPDAEIVVVDSSSDRTAEIAESLARVIKQLRPRG